MSSSAIHKCLCGPRGFVWILPRYVLLKSPLSSVDCYLAKHWQHTKVTTEFPILLRQLLSLCCEHLQAAKTAVVSGRRDWTGLGILSPPGSQHVALGAHTSMGQPTGGICIPLRREEGEAQATSLLLFLELRGTFPTHLVMTF